MPSIVQRFPATTLAAIIALVGIAAAAALLLGTDDAGTARFALLLGIVTTALTAILSVQRTEQGNAKADQIGETINAAVAQGNEQTPAALDALRLLVEATNRANKAAETIERAANGHANGDLHTRSTDR